MSCSPSSYSNDSSEYSNPSSNMLNVSPDQSVYSSLSLSNVSPIEGTSYIILQCADDNEYDNLISVLNQYMIHTYATADNLTDLCHCPRPHPLTPAYEESSQIPPSPASSSSVFNDKENVSPKSECSSTSSVKTSANRKRKVLPLKFYEYVLEILMTPGAESLAHFSGTVDPTGQRGLEFTIPDRRRFAAAWGARKGDPNYSPTFLVNKDFWNVTKKGVMSRVAFTDPTLVYRYEPHAYSALNNVLSQLELTMENVFQYALQYTRHSQRV